MKKLFLSLLITVLLIPYCSAGIFNRSDKKPVLYLTAYDPRVQRGYDDKIEPVNVFRLGDRIYFSVYTKKGFKSDYIKYQIVRQDDNAHIGGYSRVMNKTVKVSNKNYYIDYFVINRTGKYFIQIFDIENLQQWIVMGAFAVLDE